MALFFIAYHQLDFFYFLRGNDYKHSNAYYSKVLLQEKEGIILE
jgi:hypothetical protein